MAQLSGFDTEFVDPPQELQYDCSICLSILRDPQLFHCCGMSFCQGCIKPLLAERQFKCPLCKGDPNPIVPDKRLHRQLNQRDVLCPKKKIGCEWTGPLADFDSHLNFSPSPTVRLKGCRYVILKCLYCNEEYPRGELEDHENECPQKPYQCEYCKEYTGTKFMLSNQHYGVCPYYPIPCTNVCGDEFARCKLDSHLINDCPLTTVNCDFHYAGCDAWLMRRDLSDHFVKHAKRHAALLAEENTLLFLDIGSLQQDVGKLRKSLYTTVIENMECIEMNESLLQEQDKMMKKMRDDEIELSVVHQRLEEKEVEIQRLAKKLNEAEEKATKALEEKKKALDQCKNKESVLKTHTTAVKHYREQMHELETKLDEQIVEATKKESLLDRYERKNTTLQTKLAKKETQFEELTKEMEAMKTKQGEETKALQFEIERKNKIIDEQEKQLEKIKSSPVKPQPNLEGEEWPNPEDADFNPYEDSDPVDGASEPFVPYTTYREQRIHSELSQPPPEPEASKNTEWIGVSKKKKKRTPPPRNATKDSGTDSGVGNGNGTGVPHTAWQRPLTTTEAATPITSVPWQQPLPASVSSTNSKPARPMDFSAVVKKDSKAGASPNTPPRPNRSRTMSASSSKGTLSLDSPKRQCKLMIRNTPSRNRDVTDDEIVLLFSKFGRVLGIDRNGSNTAIVYDNMASVTKAVVASDRRMLKCGGIILNCTYEKPQEKQHR